MENSVVLDSERGVLEFSGRFMPQNPKEYYDPIFEWIARYTTLPHRKTVVVFKLDYFNTSSSKKILDVLLMLRESSKQMDDITIEWYHGKDDIDIKEAGYGYAELVDIPFTYIEY